MEGRDGCFNTCPGVRYADITKLGQGKRNRGPWKRNFDCLLLLSKIEKGSDVETNAWLLSTSHHGILVRLVFLLHKSKGE